MCLREGAEAAGEALGQDPESSDQAASLPEDSAEANAGQEETLYLFSNDEPRRKAKLKVCWGSMMSADQLAASSCLYPGQAKEMLAHLVGQEAASAVLSDSIRKEGNKIDFQSFVDKLNRKNEEDEDEKSDHDAPKTELQLSGPGAHSFASDAASSVEKPRKSAKSSLDRGMSRESILGVVAESSEPKTPSNTTKRPSSEADWGDGGSDDDEMPATGSHVLQPCKPSPSEKVSVPLGLWVLFCAPEGFCRRFSACVWD